MLVYRVLGVKDEYYQDEVWGYEHKWHSSFGSGGYHLKGINTFDYQEDAFKRHYFIFVEDAKKYLEIFSPNHYKIGEFKMDEKLAILYSGFGTYYETISHPTLEIAIPTTILREQCFLPILMEEYQSLQGNSPFNGPNLVERLSRPFCFPYYKLSGVEITGKIFEKNDSAIAQVCRKFYQEYQNGAYQEFLQAYNVIWTGNEIGGLHPSSHNDTFEKQQEKREKVLQKYKLL